MVRLARLLEGCSETQGPQERRYKADSMEQQMDTDNHEIHSESNDDPLLARLMLLVAGLGAKTQNPGELLL